MLVEMHVGQSVLVQHSLIANKGLPRHRSVLSAHPLHFDFAVQDNFLQADGVSMPDLRKRASLRCIFLNKCKLYKRESLTKYACV